jgi:hypothetical protein
MVIGYIQQSIVALGKSKGIVTVQDIAKFYTSDRIHREMNKLVVLGFFEQVNDKLNIKWKYKSIK